MLETENSMMEWLAFKMHELDPDILIQHNAYAFGLDVLAARMSALRIRNWDQLGRVRNPTPLPYRKGQAGFQIGRSITVGRLVCDTLLSARELMPKQTDYELVALARETLKMEVL